MVGFHKSDSMTANQKLIAGCMSGVATRFITQPLDIIKLRTQLPRKKKGMVKTFRLILSEEGVKAFWHGHILGQMHSILSVSSQFFVYELTTEYAYHHISDDARYRPYIRLICGSMAGCCSATLVIPLEVIRVRQMMIKDQYKGVISGAKNVFKYGGIFAFYEGLTASLLQMGPQVGISFVVFSYSQPVLLHWLQSCVADGSDCAIAQSNNGEEKPKEVQSNNEKASGNKYSPQNLLIASTVAGSLAGFLSKSMTYPFDLAKRRLQIASHRHYDTKYIVPSTSRNLIKCKSLYDCIVKTIEKEGVKGLFRGWSVTIGKAQVTSIVAFTSYELLCYSVREYNTL